MTKGAEVSLTRDGLAQGLLPRKATANRGVVIHTSRTGKVYVRWQGCRTANYSYSPKLLTTAAVEPPSIAEQIAAELFTNGVGDKADRLVLAAKDGRDLGGWCEGAVRDVIANALKPRKRKVATDATSIASAA